MVESAKNTVLHSDDFRWKAGFIVDQQGTRVYLKKELEAAGLATPQSPFLGGQDNDPSQPVAKIHISRELVLCHAQSNGGMHSRMAL